MMLFMSWLIPKFDIDDIPSNDEWIMENVERGWENENINLDYALKSYVEDKHFVEDQGQGGGEEECHPI